MWAKGSRSAPVHGLIKHHLSCSISRNGKKKKMSLKVSVLLHSAVPDTDQAAIFTHPGPSPEAPRSAGELLAQMEAISYTCFQRVRRIRDSQRRSGASSGASPLPRINKQEVYDCLCVTKTHEHTHTYTPQKKKKNETPCLCFSSPEAQKSVICSRNKNTHDVFTSGWQTDRQRGGSSSGTQRVCRFVCFNKGFHR